MKKKRMTMFSKLLIYIIIFAALGAVFYLYKTKLGF